MTEPMTRPSIAQNVVSLKQRIQAAARDCARPADSIRLLAVSKQQPAASIRAAAAAGLSEFGENYLQESLDKMTALADLPLCWHFIGPIQSNKSRAIANHFDWIHSIDRLKIARRLSEQREPQRPPLQICLQVNIGAEHSKAGVSPAALAELAAAVNELPRLNLRGLMTIPPPTSDRAVQRAAFAQLRHALESLQAATPQLDTLSMGMSADLEAAIAEGATLLRIGTALFGARGR